MKNLYTNEVDTVIAESLAEAAEVHESYTDVSAEENGPWSLVDPETDFTVMFEADQDGNPIAGETVIPASAIREPAEDTWFNLQFTAKAKYWAEVNQKIFLCTTEY